MTRISSRSVLAMSVVASLGALLAARTTVGQPGASAAVSVVEAERAFSRLAGRLGHVPAFLAYFADDVVTFQPSPAVGKQRLREAAEKVTVPPAVKLDWEPWFADAATAGELAYTTGPSIFTDAASGKVLRTGWYFSIWKHDASGWRVAADIGIQAPPAGDLRPRTVDFGAPAEQNSARQRSKDDVLEVERQLADAVAKEGLVKGYVKYVAPFTRLYRDDAAPAVGPAEIGTLLAAQASALACRPLDAHVSASGDLAYSIGECDLQPARGSTAAKAGFLRAWKGGAGGWRIAADVVTR